MGLAVYDTEDRYLGRIASIMPTGSNDVYVVRDPKKGAGYEVLVPALEKMILSVDLEDKEMRVDLPEELRPDPGRAGR